VLYAEEQLSKFMMMAQLRIEGFHHGLRVDEMKEVKLTTPSLPKIFNN